jgi:hypothetical protein
MRRILTRPGHSTRNSENGPAGSCGGASTWAFSAPRRRGGPTRCPAADSDARPLLRSMASPSRKARAAAPRGRISGGRRSRVRMTSARSIRRMRRALSLPCSSTTSPRRDRRCCRPVYVTCDRPPAKISCLFPRSSDPLHIDNSRCGVPMEGIVIYTNVFVRRASTLEAHPRAYLQASARDAFS